MDFVVGGKKKRKTRRRQVSATARYQEDYKKYQNREEVVEEINKIIGYFKNKEDNILKSEYNMHDLIRAPLEDYSSLHLFPGKKGNDDIVILFKSYKNDHVVFQNIGTHEHVYRKSR